MICQLTVDREESETRWDSITLKNSADMLVKNDGNRNKFDKILFNFFVTVHYGLQI